MDGIGISDIDNYLQGAGVSDLSPVRNDCQAVLGPGSRTGAGWVRIPSAIRGRNPDADEPSPRVGGRLIYGWYRDIRYSKYLLARGGVHGTEPGPKGPPGSGIASDALSGVRSVKKCLVPKRQGGTPRLRLALRDGADAPLQCLPLVGCDRPGNA